MAYQTGTAAGTTDLLDKLDTFAVANGWTLNRREAASLSISKGTVYQNLWEDGTQVKFRLATGYDSGQAWNTQPGSNPWTNMSREMAGSFTRYHFFASSDYIHIVVEVDPGLFKHICFGQINKSSAYDGGEYSCGVILDNNTRPHGLWGSYDDSGNVAAIWNAMNTIRVVADSQNQWRQINLNTSVADFTVKSSEYWHQTGSGEPGSYYKDWFINSPNTSTLQTILIPVHLFVQRPSSLVSPLGFVNDLRLVNITNIDPGATISIGSDEWLIFPEWQKNVSPSLSNGYAYKKIP